MLFKKSRSRIFYGYAFLALLIGATGIIVYFSATKINNDITHLSQSLIRKNILIQQLRQNSINVQTFVLKHIYSQNAKERIEIEETIKALFSKNTMLIDSLKGIAESEEERNLINTISVKRNYLRQQRDATFRSVEENPASTMKIYLNSELPAYLEYAKAFDKLGYNNLVQTHRKGEVMIIFVNKVVKFTNVLLVSTFFVLLIIGYMIRLSEKRLKLRNTDLQKSETKFKHLMDAVPDGTVGINTKGEIILFNRQAEKLFGYAASEILGQWSDKLIPERYRKSYKEYIGRYFTSPVNRSMGGSNKELFALRKNGEEFPVDISLNYLQSENEMIALSSIRDITERKKTETALQQSEIFIKGILSALISHVGVMDSRGIIIAVNDAWTDAAKMNDKATLERLPIGANFLEYLKGAAAKGNDYAQQLLIGIDKVFNKEVKKYELKYPCYAEDKECWFIIRIINFGGDKEQVVISNLDITEIIIAKQQVENSERNLKEVMDNSNEMIWSMDRQHRLIIFNKVFRDEYTLLVGIPPVPGIIHYKVFGPEGEEYWKEKVDETLLGKELSFERTYQIGTKTKHIEVFLFPITKENTIEGVTCFVMNITERKKVEEVLKQSEQRLKKAQEVAHLGSWELDFGLDIITWSDETCKIYGLAPSENKQTLESWLSFIHPNDMEFVLNSITQSLETLSSSSLNHRIIRKDGIMRHVYSECVIESNEDGKPLRLYGITYDVTEQKIAEEKLIHNNEALQKANKELDRFVYSTSHDLRAPLTSVLGLLNFIEEETKEPDTLEHAHMIRARIKRLDDFVTNILNYSRNNRLEIDPVLINFNHIIEQTVEGLQHMEQAKQIHFEIDINANNPFYSDLERITTIFENLIGNAIKYYDPQQTKKFVSIHVNVTPLQADIVIQDNGIGIADEHQSKIFEMFYRISGSQPGSGLGLYLVKEIIDKLEGTICIQSKLNNGTKFLITLKNLIDGRNN